MTHSGSENTPGKKEESGPLVIKAGSVSVKIYRTKNRDGILFTVSHYTPDRGRQRTNFRKLDDAKREAQRIATKIHNGETEALKLTNVDRSAHVRASSFLRPHNRTIDMAAQEYAEAAQLLAGTASILEAARFYIRHHPTQLPRKMVREVAVEMMKAKESDGMSARYISDLDSRFGRLCEKFGTVRISDVTTAELRNWIASLGLRHRSRNNFRACIVALFNFAKSRGYLAKQQPTEAEDLSKAKGPESPNGIFQPKEIANLLEHADESLVPYLAIGAFAGLRTAEIQRLSWSEVKLEQGHIEVTAGKAKTAQRRLVPIQPNLARWLEPYAQPTGLVCKLATINQKASAFSKSLKIDWPHNGLRHSYASYRLAQCKSAAEVSLEMGNSPQMVFRHYREVVTAVESQKWWTVAPLHEGKIVSLSPS